MFFRNSRLKEIELSTLPDRRPLLVLDAPSTKPEPAVATALPELKVPTPAPEIGQAELKVTTTATPVAQVPPELKALSASTTAVTIATPSVEVKTVPALGAEWTNKFDAKQRMKENDYISHMHVLEKSSKPQMLMFTTNRYAAYLVDSETFEKTPTRIRSCNQISDSFELSDGRVLYYFSEHVTDMYDPKTGLEPVSVDARISCSSANAAMLSENIFVCLNRQLQTEINFYHISDLSKPIDTLKLNIRASSIAVLGVEGLVTGSYDGQVDVYQKIENKYVKTSDTISSQLAELAEKNHTNPKDRVRVLTMGAKRDRLIILDDYFYEKPAGLVSSWQLNEDGKVALISVATHPVTIVHNIVKFNCGERFLINKFEEGIILDSKLKSTRIDLPKNTRGLHALPDGRFVCHDGCTIQTIQFGPIVPDEDRVKQIVQDVLFPTATVCVLPLVRLIADYAFSPLVAEVKEKPAVVATSIPHLTRFAYPYPLELYTATLFKRDTSDSQFVKALLLMNMAKQLERSTDINCISYNKKW